MPTWGRGGAGNIVSDEQIAESTRRQAEDLEANTTSTSIPNPLSSTNPPPSYTLQDCAHMGRGGAGNWFVPAESPLPSSSDPTSSTTEAPAASSKPNVSKPWTPPDTELPIARGGRGGAGNFVWESEEEKRRKEELKREREEGVRERVAGEVEKGLKMPERVVLGGVKGGRGW